MRRQPWDIRPPVFEKLEEPVKLCGTCGHRQPATKRCSMNGMVTHYQQFGCKMHSVGIYAATLPAYKETEINKYFCAENEIQEVVY